MGRPVNPRAASPPEGLQVFRIDVAGLVLALVTYEVSKEAQIPPLTDAERAVLRALLRGLSNEQIASQRGTSPRTIANQVAALYRKLGVRSRTALMARHASFE